MMDSESGAFRTPEPLGPRYLEDLVTLLQAAEQIASIGSWEWLPRSDTRRWSNNMYQLFGLEPGEVTPSRQWVLNRLLPADQDRAARYIRSAVGLDRPPPIELRFQHRTLGIRHLRLTIATFESDARGPTRIVGVVQDVTYEHVTKQQIAAFGAVSNTLARWDSLSDGVVSLLGELCRALEFSWGTLWLPKNGRLVPTATWSEPGPELAALTAATSPLRCSPGTGLPGRVWRSERPEILADPSEDELPRRRVAAVDAGLRAAIAIPALHLGEVITVIEFYHRQEPAPIDLLLPALVAIGNELGEFFSRRGGELGGQHLTERQLRVLMLAAAGNTTPQIAAELGLSASTVRTHFDHVYEALGVADRAAAVAVAMRLGLIR
jgi:DNA-binding CsgD family transcriptional regulator